LEDFGACWRSLSPVTSRYVPRNRQRTASEFRARSRALEIVQ